MKPHSGKDHHGGAHAGKSHGAHGGHGKNFGSAPAPVSGIALAAVGIGAAILLFMFSQGLLGI